MNQSASFSFGRHLAQPKGRAARVAVIAASWHRDIVHNAVRSFSHELQQRMSGCQIEVLEVPGAFEIPLQAKLLAQSGAVDAIVACGLVVDGGIYRHDFVATAVIDGLMRVQLDTLVPVLSVVLTPHHFHEHDEHQGYFTKHFITKGQEAARACDQVLRGLGFGAATMTDDAAPKVWSVRGAQAGYTDVV